MKLRLTLEQKGMILVAVPLTFMLLMITALLYLNAKSTEAFEQADHARVVVDRINELQTNCLRLYELVDKSSDQMQGKNSDAFARFFEGHYDDELIRRRHELEILFNEIETAGAGAQNLRLKRVGYHLFRIEDADLIAAGGRPATTDSDAIVFDLKTALESKGDVERNDTEIVTGTEVLRRAREAMEQVMAILHKAQAMYHDGRLRENEERRDVVRTVRRQFLEMVPLFDMTRIETQYYNQQRNAQVEFGKAHQSILLGGSVLLVLMTISLFGLYTRQVVKGLDKLTDNYVRLAAGSKLTPVLTGDDEFTRLDRKFHSMAEALTDLVARIGAMVENANDVVFALDAKGNFNSVNPACERVFGYMPDELLGNKLVNLAVETEIPDLLNALKLAGEGGAEPPFEFRLRRKDGRVIDLLCSAHWSAKEGLIFCIAHDMTERKQAERLRHEVVQMVSHDLKTPLSTVRSFLEMLDAGVFGEISDRGQRLLKLADNSTARMLTLTRDLLDIEKMEAGMLNLERSDVQLKDLFEQAAGGVSAQASHAAVKVLVDSTKAVVFADPDRVVQILVNLLNNAIKFSPRGGTVTISAVESGGMCRVQVSDVGRGVPVDKLPTIFDRFSQVKTSDATEKGGSGLGLAICKALTELHGGKMFVTSEVDKGSTFAFTLPFSGEVGRDISTPTDAVELKDSSMTEAIS